ncbi:MAG: hypothetical protein Q4E39_00760 [bacterium]|nr:hypothetical protein [bacterium]
MKYLKYTMALFVCAFALTSIGVSASQYTISNITIPAIKGTWISPQKDKSTSSIQRVKKTRCTDNVSGDGRVIIGRTYSMLAPSGFSSWIEVPYSYNNWGSENSYMGSFKLNLQSNKNLPTAATFSGVWSY